VLLYELLTGSPPWPLNTRPVHEVARAVVEEQPAPPSRLRSGIPADVDAIVLKALRKAAEWRYRTAGEMAADIVRYERNKRVLAREESLRYLMERTIRRVIHPTDSPFHTQGSMLMSAGLIAVWLLLERHQV